MNTMDIIITFICAEVIIGICVTCKFIGKRILFPVISFLIEYWNSYKEFQKWRKHNG